MNEEPQLPGYRAALPPPRFNMAAYCIGRAAASNPDKPALIVISDPSEPPAEVWTFAGIERAVLGIAAALRAEGLEPGSRLMIRLENTSSYALLFFGAIAGGYVPLPTSSQLTDHEAAFLLEDSGASAIALADGLPLSDIPAAVRVFGSDAVRAMAAHAPGAYADTACDDPGYLIYTSGTTSRPKGVLHAQRAAWGRRPMYEGWYGIGPNDRVLHAGAFNWTYTLGTGLTDPWANGATAIVYTGPKDPAVWPCLIRSAGATIFAAVPSLYRQMLRYADMDRAALGPLRHGLIAGETPPPGLFEEWSGRTGLQLHEALGMSEISTYISTSPTVPRKPGAVGKPQAGRSVAILPVEGGTVPLAAGEEGLLAVHRSDPGLMLGYWQRPAEEAEVFRGAFTALSRGELEAARAIGMHRALMFRRIVAPQVLRYAIPGLGNVWQLVLKESALISATGLGELLRQAQIGAGATRQPFTFYLTAAILYLAITTVSTWGFRRAEGHAMRGLRRA